MGNLPSSRGINSWMSCSILSDKWVWTKGRRRHGKKVAQTCGAMGHIWLLVSSHPENTRKCSWCISPFLCPKVMSSLPFRHEAVQTSKQTSLLSQNAWDTHLETGVLFPWSWAGSLSVSKHFKTWPLLGPEGTGHAAQISRTDWFLLLI